MTTEWARQQFSFRVNLHFIDSAVKYRQVKNSKDDFNIIFLDNISWVSLLE